MKTFKRVILVILTIIAILLIIAYLLPKNWHVERSVSINANKNYIYTYTANFGRWDLWTPWTKEVDSTVKFEMMGPDGQVGTTRKWDGKTLGNGEIKITEQVPGEYTGFDVAFNKGQFKSKGKIIIEQTGDSSKVTWQADGSTGYNPVARYFGLLMDHLMGGDFEKALSKLKKVVEGRKNWPRIEEKMTGEQLVLLVRDSAGPTTYPQVMGKAYGEIMDFIVKNKLQESGKPFAIYLKWDSITKNSIMDIGLVVDKETPGKGRIRFEKIPAQKVIMAYYIGDYNNFSPVYDALHQTIKESEMQITGNPCEIYITGPQQEKDSTKWETDIYFPVK